MKILCCVIGFQANVSPKVDFIEDNKGDLIPPKIQGVRVIVDATKMNGNLVEITTVIIQLLAFQRILKTDINDKNSNSV